ncbi:MAG: methylated-DNA--[protein]-cysteine S-methyltransferase [Rubrivivax sp.]
MRWPTAADAAATAALPLLRERMPTPLGPLLILCDAQQRLRGIDWEDHEARLMELLTRQYRPAGVRVTEAVAPTPARAVLQAYFDGDLTGIDRLPLVLGGTAFQREVWTALRMIPAGQTVSYRALATSLGRPAAMRATGLANGANPISIVLPCHRVIGSNGSLTGYGGGLPRKRWLLEHEQRWGAA